VSAAVDRRATSVGKALSVLETFGAQGRLLGVTEVASRTGVSKSSAHRLLSVLVEHGYVERQDGHYRLGAAVLALGQTTSQDLVDQLRSAAMPFMTSLYVSTGAAVHLGVLDGDDVLYVEKIFGHGSVTVPSRVGSRLPALCTGLGKAMLAFSAPAVTAAALRTPVPQLTARTVVAPARLTRSLDFARRNGVAVDSEGVSLGARCIAAPILCAGSREPAGALSLTLPSSSALSTQTVVELRRAAAGIATEMATVSGGDRDRQLSEAVG
jgi:DNA-binding IclR family transcriptional regulator